MISVSFILLKFILHVTNKQFLDKFDNGLKKIKMADFLRFLALLFFYLKKVGYCNLSSASSASALTFTCGLDNLKIFSCILPKFLCILLITSSRTSSIMTEKIKMADLLRFFAF